jgi:MinD-like ATPase involved in chromosome partitioning or flagellar assembly
VDLPTYTSIWRIEKRLYKLYDFRLPMPVPVGQIAVFAAITVPYVILLTILGLPFNHTLFWLYVLPPGVITWLATRPVLESKRLPELVISQVRYLGEPGIWCRMAPLAEKDDVVVIGKVWRRDERSRTPAEAPALAPAVPRPAPARVRPARKAAVTQTSQASQASAAGQAARVPGAAPAQRPRRREQRGRPAQWPVTAAGSVGPPPAVVADTAPAEIAADQRQAPLPPVAEHLGRPASRPGFPPGAPGAPAGNGPGTARPGRPEDAPATRPAAASWPVKDPHTPASLVSGTPAGPAWTPPVPPAPVPPVYGEPATPAGPGPAHRVPATGDPVRAAGDPVSAGPDFPVGRADALAEPDTAAPAGPAGPAVSVPAQSAPSEPSAGRSAGPAGFFVGAVRPEAAEQEPAGQGPAAERPALNEPGEDRPAPEEPAAGEPAADPVDLPGAVSAGGVDDQASGPEAVLPEAVLPEADEPEAAEPEVVEPEAAVAAEAADLVAGEPEVVGPEAAEPEVTGPEVADPEAAGSVAAEPIAAEPEAVGPEAGEPDAAEPEAAPPAAEAPAAEASPEDNAPLQPAIPTASDAPGESPQGEHRQDENQQDENQQDENPQDERPPDEGLPDDDAPGQDHPDEAPADAGPPPPPAPTPWSPPVVVVRGTSGARPTMVERALSGPGQHRGGTSWREHVRVVPGGHGPGRPDMERRDRARVLLPVHGPRLIVMLGCTVGAGQTVTTLMLADVLASLRGEPVAALDLNPGQTSLSDLARTSPAGTARGLLTGATPAVPGQRGRGRLDLIAHDSVPDGGQALSDHEYARVLDILASRYPLTLTDPGASAVARVLSAADQLVLVAPASSDAARAVAMTMEWLDGHGYEELCTGAITVINGVSKRSMSHVEQAELVVRGRCRAIVRVPWDDLLGAPPAEQGISDAAADDAESRFAQLRPQVQLAYTALAGVLVSALAVGESRAATSGRTP